MAYMNIKNGGKIL